jgi:hypothetical protein
MSFHKYKQLYYTVLPLFSIYSTVIGIEAGVNANKREPEGTSINRYANVIGYTSLGLLAGITYPISFPICGGYVLYKK